MSLGLVDDVGQLGLDETILRSWGRGTDCQPLFFIMLLYFYCIANSSMPVYGCEVEEGDASNHQQ